MWPFTKKVKVELFDGRKVDLVPTAKEVLALPDCTLTMPPIELAEWAKYSFNGKRIRKKDVPPKHDWKHLQVCARRVGLWANGIMRIEQIKDPDIVALRPFCQLKIGERACQHAQNVSQEHWKNKAIQRIPLKTCPLEQTCHCNWVTLSKRDVERAR